MPFGMVQLSPDTRLEGWDGCSGYHYSDSIVYGFSHTHLSGTGVSDYGDILLMPTTGQPFLDNGYPDNVDKGYASRFKKKSEYASPGYYEVQLQDYNIDVSLTCTERAGVHKYTFNDPLDANVILDLKHRDMLIDANINLENISNKEISGYRFSKAWAQNQKLFFVIQFSQQPELIEKEVNEKTDHMQKAAFRFELSGEGTLYAYVGLSAVSVENARENLQYEIPNRDFERVKLAAEEAWQKELGKIVVEGGTKDQKTIFYTALYHSMIAPNVWSDVNGQYRGMDDKIHQLENGERHYTVFSLWDTFRATHPLFTIIQQERTNEFIRTFLRQYQQSGRLPVWELAANETDCMIGYHSISVITDAWAKGLRDWNAVQLLQAMISSAEQDHFGLDSYKKNGCILASDEPESVSKTLEYAYDDWCIAQMAKDLGREDIYQTYIQRAQNYKNLYDPITGFFRARMDGGWFGPFDPAEVNFNYTEANAWQYSLFVPQDISGLMKLMGGEEPLEEHIEALFTTSSATTGREQADITGLIGQYAHGNEPSHHMAYLYNFVRRPWKTAQRVSQIMDEMYSIHPDGLSGNEDCGQMSSWYVLSALGMYQVTPGLPEYTFGTPLFNKATIHLENGNSFIIRRENVGMYIQSVVLNEENYDKSYLSHADIVKGGKLVFKVSEKLNKQWATSPGNFQKTEINDYPIIPNPFIESTGTIFKESVAISMGSVCDDCSIWYRIDKGSSIRYESPFRLYQSAELEFWAANDKGTMSKILKQSFFKIQGGRTIDLKCKYANQYAAGGDEALIDYQRGNTNYRTGRWQGYQGQDFEAVVDLGSVQTPKEARIGFLQDMRSWIFYPPEVQFSYSINGEDYIELQKQLYSFPDNVEGGFTQDFSVLLPGPVRYIKIWAKNYGPCPEWHLGAGGQTWLFADEIIVE
jgi:predicted alpha-1,2-mannosidase